MTQDEQSENESCAVKATDERFGLSELFGSIKNATNAKIWILTAFSCLND